MRYHAVVKSSPASKVKGAGEPPGFASVQHRSLVKSLFIGEG